MHDRGDGRAGRRDRLVDHGGGDRPDGDLHVHLHLHDDAAAVDGDRSHDGLRLRRHGHHHGPAVAVRRGELRGRSAVRDRQLGNDGDRAGGDRPGDADIGAATAGARARCAGDVHHHRLRQPPVHALQTGRLHAGPRRPDRHRVRGPHRRLRQHHRYRERASGLHRAVSGGRDARRSVRGLRRRHPQRVRRGADRRGRRRHRRQRGRASNGLPGPDGDQRLRLRVAARDDAVGARAVGLLELRGVAVPARRRPRGRGRRAHRRGGLLDRGLRRDAGRDLPGDRPGYGVGCGQQRDLLERGRDLQTGRTRRGSTAIACPGIPRRCTLRLGTPNTSSCFATSRARRSSCSAFSASLP